MNSINDAVKKFAVNVLGCGCPEEVFLSIELEKTPGLIGGIEPSFEIRIGGRLMIIGVPYEIVRAPEDSLANLVAAGMRIRDGEKFNRLRIVVVSDDPDCDAILRPRFERIPGLDDRVLLHVVKKELFDGMLNESETGRDGGVRVGELITEPTVWHEMEGPFIGGREHYQSKSYGFENLKGAEAEDETPDVKGDGDKSD
jgi:hypothetical protein